MMKAPYMQYLQDGQLMTKPTVLPMASMKISCEMIDDLPMVKQLVDDELLGIAESCNQKCEDNPLPPGYAYGPIQIKCEELGNNLMTVTAYREVYKIDGDA